MSRNLYILAGTLVLFSLVSYAIAFTGIAHEPGSPADASLWQMIGIVLLVIALISALFGILQTMFEQAERRSERLRQQQRAQHGSERRPDGLPGPGRPRRP